MESLHRVNPVPSSASAMCNLLDLLLLFPESRINNNNPDFTASQSSCRLSDDDAVDFIPSKFERSRSNLFDKSGIEQGGEKLFDIFDSLRISDNSFIVNGVGHDDDDNDDDNFSSLLKASSSGPITWNKARFFKTLK